MRRPQPTVCMRPPVGENEQAPPPGPTTHISQSISQGRAQSSILSSKVSLQQSSIHVALLLLLLLLLCACILGREALPLGQLSRVAGGRVGREREKRERE